MPNWKKLIVSGSDANLNSLDITADNSVGGLLKVADGSNSAPSITFTDDTDTGIYRSTDNTFNVTVGGTNMFAINSSGITSGANVYSGTNGQFRNYAGVWKATTGTTGNGFNFTSADLSDLLTISSTGDSVFKGDITITDTTGTRGISRNNTGYNLNLMGGTDLTDGAYISLSGETRGGASNSYNGRIEIYSGGSGLANQAAALGDIIFGTKWNGGSSNILVLDSSTNNATFAGNATFNGDVDADDVTIDTWGSVSASLATLTQNQIDGSGTADYVARFSDANTLTTGLIQDDGSSVGINAGPSSKMLYVNGTGQFTGELFFTHFDQTSTNASRFRDDTILRFGTNRIFGIKYNSTADQLQFVSSSNTIVSIDGDGNITGSASIHASGSGSEIITDQIFRAAQGTLRFRKGTNTWDAMMMSTNGRLELANGGANDRGEIYLHADHGSTPRAGVVTFENESQGTSYLFTDTNKRLKFHTSDPGEDDSVGEKVLYNNFPDTATFAGDVTVEGTLTAQEFHTEFVSASIIYESGSTKFGDTSDDIHSFSGSLRVTGSGDHYFTHGNVGIGATAPSSKLQIGTSYQTTAGTHKEVLLNMGGYYSTSTGQQYSVIGFTGTTIDSTDIYAQSGSETSKNFYAGLVSDAGYFNGSRFSLIQSGSERFTVAGPGSYEGNIGLGVAEPRTKLHIAGSTAAASGLRQSRTGVKIWTQEIDSNGKLQWAYRATEGGSATQHFTLNDTGQATLHSYGSGTHTGTLAKSLGVDSSGNIIEFTGGSGGGTVSSISSGADNRVAVFSGTDSLEGDADFTFDGANVGIGTTTPSYKLDIRNADSSGINISGASSYIRWNTGDMQIKNAGSYAMAFDTWTGSSLTEKMRITSDGKVGIGTTSPAVTLHVDGFTRINGGLQLNQNGAAQVYQIQNNALRFGTNNTERMRILADGKVGIGTTNPIYPFHVVGSAYVNSGTLFIDSGQRLKWGNSNQFIEGTNDTSLEFGTGGSTKMYLDNSGNLGIGTTSPGAKLDVNGDVYINSNYPSNVAANDLTIGKTTTGDHGLTIVTSNSNTAGIFFADNDNNDAGRIKYQHSNNSMRFETNRSEAMRIDSSGNVGIGTTSPASKLEVQTGYIISSGSGAADLGFVLDRAGLDTYHIRHLDGGLTIYNNTDNRKEMTFDGTGKVGIGTSTPATTLDVNGEIQNNGIFRRGGNVIIKSTGSETMFGPGGSGIITFHNSATMTTGDETIRIDADGNLLLNNTSAAARLDIREDTNYAIRAEDASGHYFRVNTGGDVDMRGDLVVQGTITAQEFHTEFVSASIIYDSGSTKFGDTLDDNHDFTGSVNVSGSMVLTDNTKLQLGSNSTAGDLRIFHTGTVSKIANNTGDLEITQFVDDGDIKFLSDDGSGGTTEYFRVDGGSEVVLFNKGIRLVDNQRLDVGGATDGRFYHDGTDTQLVTITGDLIIKNSNDDGDIQFRSDDGSGGTAEYFRVDGGATKTIVSKAFQFFDSVNLEFGDSSDLQIFHNSADTWFDNYTGNINFRNRQDDGDIIFHSDDGSGGIAQYLRVDGGIHETVFSKSTRHMDSVYAKFGSGEDLKIYHDGSNSYINEVGVGSLIIQASDLFLRAGGTNNTNNALRAVNGGTVTLFHANSAKLDTTSAGITVTGDIDADDITIDDWGSVSASLSAIQTAGGVNGTGASNKVAVWSDSDTLTSDTNLHWDSSNDRLGIGATSPAFKTTIYSDSSTDSFPLVVGQPNAANEFVGIGLSGFVASNGAVKAGLVLDRKSTYGVGDIHILNNSTTDNSNATLADSKLTILQNGNVGIGTTDPGTDNLRVSGTGRVARILATNDSVPLVVQNTSGATARIGFKGTTSTSDYHVSVGANGQNYTVYTDNAERMRITSTGNVGIGTTSPATTLDVYGTSDTYLTVRNSGGGNKAGIRMYGGSAGISHIWHDDTETNPPGIHFGTSADTATTPTTQLYIKGSNGNVGIGTSSPGKTLHVAGEISGSAIQVIGGSSTNKFYSTNTGAIAEFKPSDTRSGMQPIFLYRSTVTGTANYMLASGGTTLFGLYDSGVPSDLSGMVRITPNNSSEAPAVRIGDAGSNGAYLDIGGNIKLLNNGNSYINGGNVGIGTSSPGTKLHVSDGTFKVQSTSSNNRGVKITPNGEIEQVSSAADWLHLQRNHNGKVAIGADSTADLHVYNDLLIDTAKISYQENTDVDSAAAETIATVTHASYDAAFFDYVVKNGTNLRAGTVMAVHDGTNVEFTDNSTKDIGTTSGVTFSVDISGTDLRLRATTTTDNWTIKTLVRTL